MNTIAIHLVYLQKQYRRKYLKVAVLALPKGSEPLTKRLQYFVV